METKFLEIPFQVKQIDETGAIIGYGSIFDNVDLQGDIVRKGAFTKSLQSRPASEVKMLLSHDDRKLPVGVWKNISEDNKGLLLEGILDLSESSEARRIRSLQKLGVKFGLSIGFKTREFKETIIDGETVTELLELELNEVSIVNFAANQEADVIAIKSKEQPTEKTNTDFEYKSAEEVPAEIKEVEKYLKSKGLSAKESKTIISKIKDIDKQRDVADQKAERDAQFTTLTSLTSRIDNLTQHLKGN